MSAIFIVIHHVGEAVIHEPYVRMYVNSTPPIAPAATPAKPSLTKSQPPSSFRLSVTLSVAMTYRIVDHLLLDLHQVS